jgi:hypothetical protein
MGWRWTPFLCRKKNLQIGRFTRPCTILYVKQSLLFTLRWADTATLVKSRAGTLGIYGVFRANCGVKGTCGVCG